jgi:hypothetical protein
MNLSEENRFFHSEDDTKLGINSRLVIEIKMFFIKIND